VLSAELKIHTLQKAQGSPLTFELFAGFFYYSRTPVEPNPPPRLLPISFTESTTLN